MKKFGKNKFYLDNLIGFDADYKKESKISKLRNRFNSIVREKGNNLHNGLGDLLTEEFSEREKGVIFFGAVLSLFLFIFLMEI